MSPSIRRAIPIGPLDEVDDAALLKSITPPPSNPAVDALAPHTSVWAVSLVKHLHEFLSISDAICAGFFAYLAARVRQAIRASLGSAARNHCGKEAKTPGSNVSQIYDSLGGGNSGISNKHSGIVANSSQKYKENVDSRL